MNYELKVLDLGAFEITEEEYKSILQATGAHVLIKRIGVTFSRTTPWSIRPKDQAYEIDRREERRNQKVGFLHDGSKVKNHFGQWVDFTNQTADDNGNTQSVRIDPEYYPEIAMDCVATAEEWERIKNTGQNYYEFLLGKEYREKIESYKTRLERKGGFQPLIG